MTAASMTLRTDIARRRVRPFYALRAFLRVARDPEDTLNGARFVLALDGNRSEENFQRFAADPFGAQILAERRSLIAALSDRAALGTLPAESLGRAYLTFMEEEKISAEGLAAAVAPADRELGEYDADRQLIHERIGAMHDLWHVITGYSRDILGELQLLAFSHVQLRTRVFGWLVPLAAFANERRIPGTRRLIAIARERAAAAPWLPVQDWEALLARPLDEVRQTLRIGTPPVYTRHFRNPNGFGLIPEVRDDAASS